MPHRVVRIKCERKASHPSEAGPDHRRGVQAGSGGLHDLRKERCDDPETPSRCAKGSEAGDGIKTNRSMKKEEEEYAYNYC